MKKYDSFGDDKDDDLFNSVYKPSKLNIRDVSYKPLKVFEDDKEDILKEVYGLKSKYKTPKIELPSLSSKLLKEDYTEHLKIKMPDISYKPKGLDMPKLLYKPEEIKMPDISYKPKGLEMPLYKPKKVEIPDLSYKPKDFGMPKLFEKRPSIEEENWRKNVSPFNKALLSANGVNPYNFKSEKKRRDLLDETFGKDNSFTGKSLRKTFNSSLGHTSLDRMLHEGKSIMASRWGKAMKLGRKA